MSDFIDELVPAATLEANARGITLTVVAAEEGVAIEADRQVLAAVVRTCCRTPSSSPGPRTTVTLRVGASAERVLIEVEDECGGLPDGDANELFRPFEQRAPTGRASARPRVQPMGRRGEPRSDYARNLPHGCVFTVDLPRCPTPAEAASFATA